MNLNELTSNSAWNSADELATILKEWADAYYNEGNSPVEDSVFDAGRRRLEILNPYHPYLSVVGAPVNSNGEERHKIPMGSLNNVNNEEEFRKWWDKVNPESVVVQYKYDGLSIGLEYEDGQLTKGLLRGDGIYGENKTENINRCYHADSINVLRTLFSGSVRGEGIIYKEDFNDKNFPGESNPRNSSVGAVRKSNSPRIQWVRMACYDIVGTDEYYTEEEKLQHMESLGLPVCEYKVFQSADEVIAFYNETIEKRDELPFAVDGLVIKINDTSKQKELGSHKGRPKWARAFKFACLRGISTVKNIILTVGHTGSVIPTAEYDPILIDGRTFQHALLDNFDTIEKHNLNIGDDIEIEITGDIIPKLAKVINKNSDGCFERPTNCPVCGAPTEIDGAATKCTGQNCSAKMIGKINNWIKKTGIKYLGESRQKELYENGVVTSPADLYRVTRDQIGDVIGGGNAVHVINEIDKYRTLPLNVFMGSLGIKFLGRSNAEKLIAAGIDTLEKFRNLNPSEISIPGFGQNLVEISNGIQECSDLIDDLLDSGVMIQEDSYVPESNGDSPSFCFTGVRLGHLKPKFEEKGWIEKSCVSAKLDYLVAKDPTATSNKLKKAREKGVNIISMMEFEAILES